MADVVPGPGDGSLADLLPSGPGSHGVQRLLNTIRRHMSMNVAYVARLGAEGCVVQHVDADGESQLRVGYTFAPDSGYCHCIVEGELPNILQDAVNHPITRSDALTPLLGIRAHMAVPLVLEDGEVYGTLCCYSYKPEPTLGDRDLQMMRGFAEVLAYRIGEALGVDRNRLANIHTIEQMIAAGDPEIVFQPIYNLRGNEAMEGVAMVGVECLSRFRSQPYRPPNEWFDLAHSAGLGQELELLAIAKALKFIDRFPSNVFICVNSSPDVILSGKLDALLQNTAVERVVLEITEHSTVADYRPLADALGSLRKRGMHLAIDDAGAGYANMRHILNLLPDTIKLDMSLTRNIDTDPHRRALARALIHFAQDIGSRITAEGVETTSELEMLRSLGVDQAQGYFLGRPSELENVLMAIDEGGGPLAMAASAD
jgi:EAL domain-containing protein (putative c-di-GMP-specific phosphodiesterase class I)